MKKLRDSFSSTTVVTDEEEKYANLKISVISDRLCSSHEWEDRIGDYPEGWFCENTGNRIPLCTHKSLHYDGTGRGSTPYWFREREPLSRFLKN